MSIFASMGPGDLFSKDFFAPSPLFDLLERGNFTLEELLVEDELLQEVKTKSNQLLTFICTHEQVSKLVYYITQEPREGDDDLRTFKYPYMSCEVICCEVPEILNLIVEENGGALMEQLFGILDSDRAINHYLAGYFEKVLEVLFRRKTIQLMSYLNARGRSLLNLFLKHIDNYSIMQIIQRLLLPHIPFSIDTADLEVVPPEDRENCQCNWSFLPETADLLTSRMLDAKAKDVPYHVSDLLITVVQLSAPDAPFLGHLCDDRNLGQLLNAAFLDIPDETSTAADVSLASISVLESLISRLCETSNPFDGMNMGIPSHDGPHEKSIAQLAAIQSVSSLLVQHVPELTAQLRRYLDGNPMGTITLQTKEDTPRLGQKGLQLVKLVEATIRLGVPELDTALCQTGALAACVDLFFKFELNSLLHLSVQRIILMVLEGGSARRQTQRHLLVECRLLARVLDTMRERKEMRIEQPKKRRPIFGHLIVISQIIVTVLHQETISEPPPVPPRPAVVSETESELRGASESDSTRGSASDSLSAAVADRPASADAQETSHFRDILAETGLATAWEEFVNGDFTEIMTVQTTCLGGGNAGNDNYSHHLEMNGALDLGPFQMGDRIRELEQAMREVAFSNDQNSHGWMTGGLGTDADGDLLAVAPNALMYEDDEAEDENSVDSDEANRFHHDGGDDEDDDDDDDDEQHTPSAESTAALGQTLFFASFGEPQPGDQPAFATFAEFPAPTVSSATFEASFPADFSELSDADTSANAQGNPQEKDTTDLFTTGVDTLEVLEFLTSEQQESA